MSNVAATGEYPEWRTCRGNVFADRSGFKYSSLLLILYICLLPVSTALSGFIISASVQSLIAVLFVLVSIIEIIFSKKIRIERSIFLAYLYFMFMISTALWDRAFEVDWYSMQFMVTFLIIICVSIRHYSDVEIKLIRYAFFCSIITAWFSTLFFSFFHGGRMYIEITSLMDPNDFATGLSIAFALCLTEVKRKKRIILNSVFMISILLIVYLSGSRGGLLTMMGVIFIWVISIRGRAKYILLGSIAAAAALLLICAEFGIGPSMLSRFSVSALLASGGTGRADIWKAALKYFISQDPFHMLFGNGLGSFADTVRYVAVGNDFRYESHNMFINTLIEGGVIGLGLLITCFTTLYIYVVKNKNLFGILAVTGFMISGISLDAQVYRTFAIAAAMALIWRETDGKIIIKDNKPSGEGAF